MTPTTSSFVFLQKSPKIKFISLSDLDDTDHVITNKSAEDILFNSKEWISWKLISVRFAFVPWIFLFFRLLKLILILLCSTFLFHFLSFRLSEVPHTRANYDSWLDLLKWVEFMENIFVDAYPTHRRWIFLSLIALTPNFWTVGMERWRNWIQDLFFNSIGAIYRIETLTAIYRPRSLDA